MAYATVEDVENRIGRKLSESEETRCNSLLDGVAVEIDSYNTDATDDTKKYVSIRAVARVMGSGDSFGVPIGATQGSMSGLGYSQSFTIGGGSSGQEYLDKTEKRLLGVGNRIGSYSPVEELTR